jgi:ribosomal protein S18 acetylase RimI-like enzyme
VIADVVRIPTLDDVEGVALVHVQSWRETYTGLVPEELLGDAAFERRVRFWTSVLKEPPPRVRVADLDGEIIGFAFAGAASGPDVSKGFEPARPLHLYSIYVLASHHGTGFGQQLLDAVIDDEPAQLWVARDNPRARAFYERNGFVADGIEYVDPDFSGLVEVRMVR